MSVIYNIEEMCQPQDTIKLSNQKTMYYLHQRIFLIYVYIILK